MMTPLLLCIFFVGIQTTFACSCIPLHPQVHFCTADYVIVAEINSEENNDLTRVYNFTLQKVYKITEDRNDTLSRGKLETRSDSAACGIYLTVGEVYLLKGYINDNSMKISSCDLYQSFTSLSDYDKERLNNLYAQNCNCSVIIDGYSDPTAANKTCLWNTFANDGYSEDCQRKYAVCKYNGDSCNWEGNACYKKCYNKEV